MRGAAILILLGVTTVGADTEGPGRGVARISVLSGDVSVKRGDSGDWIAAAVNAPLVVQDRLLTGSGSRAEIQFDWANMIRLSTNAEVRLSELEHRRYQIQVARGTTTFRVLRDSDADVEISTPSVSVRPLKRGEYRVTVLDDDSSEITVRSGEAEIFTPRGSERLKAGKTMLARGTASDPEFQVVRSIPEDEWDRWNEARDRDLQRSTSYRYVSRDVYGADDLDDHGTWIRVEPYGDVWSPRVAPGWAPYRHGRWTWVDWYGWTWVSYDPWGWAPYHYGRWFSHGSRWCWYPGSIHARTYWRPALVAFFGFGRVGIGLGFGNVGWVPLAPYETYYPWYGNRYYSGYRNRNYVDNSVHVVNNINIRNVYRNSRIDNAVTAVSGSDFSRGRAGSSLRVNHSDIERASLVRGQVPFAPERESLRMADREVRSAGLPGASREDRTFYSRRQTAAVDRVPFDDQRRGVEQIARQTWRPPEPSAGTVRGEGRVGENSGRVSGLSRGLEESTGATPSARTGATGGEDGGGGWRRIGEPSRGMSPRPVETPRSMDGGARAEEMQRSWRRFGTPSRDGAGDSVGRAADNPREFGSPNATRQLDASDSSSRSVRGGGTREDGGWRRIGEGSSTRQNEATAGESGRSSQFDSPRGDRMQESRSGSRSESLRISPPIVREREAPRSDFGGSRRESGDLSRGGGRFGGGGGEPRGGEPRGGEPRGGGGGGEARSGGGSGRMQSGGESRGGGGGSPRGPDGGGGRSGAAGGGRGR